MGRLAWTLAALWVLGCDGPACGPPELGAGGDAAVTHDDLASSLDLTSMIPPGEDLATAPPGPDLSSTVGAPDLAPAGLRMPSFAPAVTYAAHDTPSAVVIGEFSGDGKLDVVAANSHSSDISVLVGNGAGALAAPKNLTVAAEPASLLAVELTGDTKTDLVIGYGDNNANSSTTQLSLLPSNGDTTFGARQDFMVTQLAQCPHLAKGDVNGDGRLDVAVLCNTEIAVLLQGAGGGLLAPTYAYGASNGQAGMALGDFHHSGRADLLAGSHPTPPMDDNAWLLTSTGGGNFSSAVDTGGPGYRAIEVGDFDGDGKLDFVGNITSKLNFVRGHGDGTFDAPVPLPVAGRMSIAVVDLNGDGKLDLAVAGLDSQVLTLLVGKGDGTFPQSINYLAGVAPFSIAAGDLNGDGKPDLVIADLIAVQVLLNTTP